VKKFDLLKPIKQGGKFVLNSPWSTLEEMEENLPAEMLIQIAERDVELYNVYATKIAREAGLGQRINMVMQAAFYHLSGVLPRDEALELLKVNIETTYGKKGPEVVRMNKECVDETTESIRRIEYDRDKWLKLGKERSLGLPTGIERVMGYRESATGANTWQGGAIDGGGGDVVRLENGEYADATGFSKAIMDPVLALEGDDLPVSVFTPGGYMPAGTTNFEKRAIAPEVPVWKSENCTQCNYCNIVCPHAVIRPFLATREELKEAPDAFTTVKAQGGAEMAGLNYSINLATMDCTGCEVCVESCPDDALFMAPFGEAAEQEVENWDFAMSLANKGDLVDKYTVKGSQFQQPLMEFSGACAGCGETPYVKLVTQLFGDRMVIANASGCSSVWGGTATTNPYTVNDEGRGPAWGRSLFEDNAEYGYGMSMATIARRRGLAAQINEALQDPALAISDPLRKQMGEWVKHMANADKCDKAMRAMVPLLEAERSGVPILEHIYGNRDMMPKLSQWIMGGDGWAYDIGFGGLDHVMQRGEDVNILVMDTEMYSNTGGQVSKATHAATVVKYASSGKDTPKKDFGQMAMMYDNVYVASVALGADMGQTVQAIKEAEEYKGTSVILAYSPCIDWGIDMTKMMDVQRAAVDSGYWSLYRFDPRRVDKGEKPFQLDSKRIRLGLDEFLKHENRFASLTRGQPERAKLLRNQLDDYNTNKMHRNKLQAMDDYELLDHLKAQVGEQTGEKVTVLYASETGNTADLARMLQYEMKRRDVRCSVMAMDDYDVADLPGESTVINLVATCGQGEYPANCRNFYKELVDEGLPSDYLDGVKFATFAMGDSGYVFFNSSGEFFDERFTQLGATPLMPMGQGDDQDADKWETAWEDWAPELWNELGTPTPDKVLPPPVHTCLVEAAADTDKRPEVVQIMPSDAGGESVLCPLTTSSDLTPGGRDVRHLEWDIRGTGLTYGVGDALGVFSCNPKDKVHDFLEWYGLKPDDVVTVTSPDREPELPEVCSAEQIFTQVLDIFGRPKRQFYEALECYATDDAERAQLAHLVSKEGRADLRALIDDTSTYADLLKKFPSAKLPLEYLMDFVPNIKPRLYSIASAPEMHPDHIHLCVVEEDWEVESTGEQRRGQSTWHIRNQTEGLEWGQVTGNKDEPEAPYGALVVAAVVAAVVVVVVVVVCAVAWNRYAYRLVPV
jgi:pyruvate/2-oxoacid:ferredoxin oxidoreductase beta subunit/sulfite reductase alpha subunit-like flavoprotein/Pyruvate/2-oxoacid:ferredoxin oxidoreductase delta subunit